MSVAEISLSQPCHTRIPVSAGGDKHGVVLVCADSYTHRAPVAVSFIYRAAGILAGGYVDGSDKVVVLVSRTEIHSGVGIGRSEIAVALIDSAEIVFGAAKHGKVKPVS